MRNRRFQAGDPIVLKPGVLGNGQPAGTGRILSCLPVEKGLVCYRVRFENETFERSIAQDDIDLTSTPPSAQAGAISGETASSWVNSLAIRTRTTAAAATRSNFASKRHR